MSKKKKENIPPINPEEKARDEAYVAFRKAKKSLTLAKSAGNDVLVRDLEEEERNLLERFLSCESALPEEKRIWKKGFKVVSQ